MKWYMKRKLIILFYIILIFSITERVTNETVTTSNIISKGNENSKNIYLTFDDGYSYVNTKAILEILKEKNVQATFFLEGGFLANHGPLINKIVDEGHIIGCHTMSHVDIRTQSNATFKKEIFQFEEKYFDITSKKMTKFFRPPMGFIDERKKKILDELGYQVFLWDVSYYDYNPSDQRTPQYAINYVTSNVCNGSIILLHTLTKTNVTALPTIIDKLRENGYIFSSLMNLVSNDSV